MSIPANKLLPEKTWKLMVQSMPIPCVDVICLNDNDRTEILYGVRKIPPLKNRWALIGGRIIKGETPEQAVQRQLQHYGITFYHRIEFNGVFSVNYKMRSDISLSFVAVGATGNPQPKEEFSMLSWKKKIPKPISAMHRQMVEKWLKRFDYARST